MLVMTPASCGPLTVPQRVAQRRLRCAAGNPFQGIAGHVRELGILQQFAQHQHRFGRPDSCQIATGGSFLGERRGRFEDRDQFRFLFRDGWLRRDRTDALVQEEIQPAFAGTDDVGPAIAVEIRDEHVHPDPDLVALVDGVAGELAALVEGVVIQAARIFAARIAVAVGAIAFARDQLRPAVAVQVGQGQRMRCDQRRSMVWRTHWRVPSVPRFCSSQNSP